jgi:transcriptional regulator of arginine metabolism
MKNLRHTAIRELLVMTAVASPNGTTPSANGTHGPIINQNDLRRKLAARGFHVTQATLSRDIRDLKLLKGPTGYALPSTFDDDGDDLPEIAGVLQDFGLEVRQAQNLLVVLTTMGGAQPVAASLDYEEWPEVVGTIAGDNTVLIVCPDALNADTLRTRLEAYLA